MTPEWDAYKAIEFRLRHPWLARWRRVSAWLGLWWL